MFKTFFLIFLLGHIIGDFYFQNSKMAEDKSRTVKAYFAHTVLYTAAIILVCIPVWSSRLAIPIVILSVSHAIIDALKAVINNTKKYSGVKEKDVAIFLADQALHILCIIFAAVTAARGNGTLTPNIIDGWLSYLNTDYFFVVKLFILILGNIRPCNVFIKVVAHRYKPAESREDITNANNSGAGAIIGVLERFLITVFFVKSQYSLIGLILTAKSIARFNKLSEDKDFAEYYLMGTLLSLLLVIGLCIVTL